ncbi:MAG: TraI domain-containing protein [Succinivibrio sp.]|nr:TraI domain-containing protein [Succinivibrio sp.]
MLKLKHFLSALSLVRRRPAQEQPALCPKPGSKDSLSPQAKVIFTVHEDGQRFYPVLSTAELLGRAAEVLQAMQFMTLFGKTEWHNGIRPLLQQLAALMGALPASEGVHDFYSGGLFLHSSRVCLRALRTYKEELLAANFYNEAQAKLYQAAIIYQAYAHDLGKLLTDFEVRGEDQELWEPRQESFAAFTDRHCQTYYSLTFRNGRGISHKERKALGLSLLLPCLTEFLRLLKNLTTDPEAVIDGTLEVKSYIANADIWDVADQNPLRSRELYVPDYLNARLGQKLYSGQFSVNEQDSPCFATDYGLLVVKDGQVHRFLVETFDLLVSSADKNINDNFINYCKPKGLLLLTGERAVYSWYLLRIEGEIHMVYGLLLRCDYTLRFGSCYCRHLGQGQDCLSEILDFFDSEKLNVCHFQVVAEHQPRDPYRVEDLCDYGPQESSLSEERQALAKRRYRQKSRLKRSLHAEQEHLEELYKLCRIEEPAGTAEQGS